MNNKNTMLKGITHAFVDIDDTLWWFTENSKVAFAHTYNKMNACEFSPSYEVFHDLYLKKNSELWDLYHHGKIEKDFLVIERFRWVLEQVGYKGDCDAMSSAMNEEYLTYLATLPTIVPGSMELVKRLNDMGLEVNVLSNGFKGIQQQKLESGGLLKYIKNVVLSDDCGYTKPMREIFDYALEVTGARAETSVMIGDNPEADIQGAHEVGWHTIYFNLKNKPAIGDTADYEVTSLDEIL